MDNLKIKYQIRSINHDENTMVVKYWVQGYEELIGDRAVYNIAIWKHPATWQDIERRIQESAPADWFKLLTSDTDLHHVDHMIGVEHEFEHKTPEPMLKIPTMSIEEIEKLLKDVGIDDALPQTSTRPQISSGPPVDVKTKSIEEAKSKAEAEARRSIEEVINTIQPLLQILGKSPEQDYINWNGNVRVKQIKEIVDKIESFRAVEK